MGGRFVKSDESGRYLVKFLDLVKMAENFFIHFFLNFKSFLTIYLFDSVTALKEKFDKLSVVEGEMNVSHFVLFENSFVFVFFFTFLATFIP